MDQPLKPTVPIPRTASLPSPYSVKTVLLLDFIPIPYASIQQNRWLGTLAPGPWERGRRGGACHGLFHKELPAYQAVVPLPRSHAPGLCHP